MNAPSTAVTWAQVHAFRLARHHLLVRAPRHRMIEVAGAIGGLQAQVMSAAEQQLATRVRCTTADVRDAVWTERTLVKTWLERGTLHLIPASDLPLYAAALGPMNWTNAWFTWTGLDRKRLDALAEDIGAALSATPITKAELVARVGPGQPKRVRELLGGSWGSMLKPAARRGLLAFGPSRGANATFVNPRKWLRSWRDLDTDESVAELARRYLRAYGPATKRDFIRWFRPSLGGRRDAWALLGDELADVSVEGTRMQILERDRRRLASTDAASSVVMLPQFDPYLMGHSTRDHLFDKVHRWKVSRIAGWISAVVLVNGRVEGTWTHVRERDTLVVTVAPFATLSAGVRRAVAARANELASALGLDGAEVRLPNAAKRDNRSDGPIQRRR